MTSQHERTAGAHSPLPWKFENKYGSFNRLRAADGSDVIWYTNDDDGLHIEPENEDLLIPAVNSYGRLTALEAAARSLADAAKNMIAFIEKAHSYAVTASLYGNPPGMVPAEDLDALNREAVAGLRAAIAAYDAAALTAAQERAE